MSESNRVEKPTKAREFGCRGGFQTRLSGSRTALDRKMQDVQPSQDDQRGHKGVERRVGDEWGEEAARPLEERAKGYRQYQENRQEDGFQVCQGEQHGGGERGRDEDRPVERPFGMLG